LTSLTIEPVSDSKEIEPLYIVLFADEPEPNEQSRPAPGDAASESAAAHLERELNETKERLQSLIEEYETALEELKSSNEELVSVNEELQSTNEELEASKEELQSLNEELHTVNIELSGKVEALDRANSDLHNLLENTQVATVFLDKNLLIRSFTPAVSQIVNILPTDKGRPITDLSSRLFAPHLAADVSAVLASGELIEYRVDNENGEGHYLVRLAPYRDADNHLNGVVATFIDVPNLTQAEARQRENPVSHKM
jgi:two-component system CheB/CheR fusion protein